ncbi:MAG: hypothetical protein LBK76_04575 [Verrucomicrobiales bacterium]|jgi:hypothetical protein|nr:hypothetical protein [Verrucomicrobiales bacterium]
MSKEIQGTLSSVLRAVALTVGGGFVAKGSITDNELETIVSAAVVLVSAAWTAWTIYQRNVNKEKSA